VPTAPAAPDAQATRTATPSAPRGRRRVLVVEDEPADREWLVGTLHAAGYTTHVADTGQAAIAACAAERFDAVVLDVLLPDMTGWDVLRAIRADERNVDVPVLVSTVVTERASSIGFAIHDYLVKPVQATDLLASLDRAGVSPERVDPVLVVDDDQMALKLMYTMLAQLGFQPVCVDRAERALAVAAEIRPSAVVLDLLMPGMDGFEFLERFRDTDVGRTTPVIVWTNKDLSHAELVRLRERASALATKASAGSDHVLEELKRHLGTRRPTPPAGTRPVAPPTAGHGEQA
jgi:DNA-binding response OmpR family regulator